MPRTPLRVVPDDDPGGGIVRVEAEVDGIRTDLVLDTGAARTGVPGSVLGGDRESVGSHNSGTVFGRQTTDRVTVESLRFGGIEHGPLLIDRNTTDDGQLGLDVLGHHRVHLDLDGGWLSLDEGDHVGTQHPLSLGRSGHPHLRMHWGEVSAYGVLDTGASVSVVDVDFAQRHPELFTLLGDTSTGTDAAGITHAGQIWTLAASTIDDIAFAAHTAAVVDLGFVNQGAERPVDLIIGYPLLRQAVWTLDWPKGAWSARPR